MNFGMCNREELDPRVIEVKYATRTALVNRISRSFRDPGDAFAWMILTWTLSFLITSAFTGLVASVLISCVVAVIYVRYRRKLCTE